MPICPKCGSLLCTEQALSYHLAKKKPCQLKLNCDTCLFTFETKLELRNHEKQCFTKSKFDDYNDSFDNIIAFSKLDGSVIFSNTQFRKIHGIVKDIFCKLENRNIELMRNIIKQNGTSIFYGRNDTTSKCIDYQCCILYFQDYNLLIEKQIPSSNLFS
jgi:hypothetical protein